MYKVRVFHSLVVLLIVVLLTGCFQGVQTLEEIDLPPDMQQSNAVDGANQENNQAYETVARQLYLLDAKGFVVGQTFELPHPESNAVAQQTLEYLIKGGPITELLPNGFAAVIPEDTEILGLDLQEDGTLVVDLSEEFVNYQADEEVKILEAMTFTLTQFTNIEHIQLKINGSSIEDMPVNGTPVSQGYSRSKGINIVQTDTVDLLESEVVTVHYPTTYNESRYYVPVTVYIDPNGNSYEKIVQTLIDGPKLNHFSTAEVFNPNTMLTNQPRLRDGVLQLEFNEFILEDIGQGIIADEVIETLIRTFTEFPDVEAVQVNVKDVETIMNEHGEVYDQPVNLEMVLPMEKM